MTPSRTWIGWGGGQRRPKGARAERRPSSALDRCPRSARERRTIGALEWCPAAPEQRVTLHRHTRGARAQRSRGARERRLSGALEWRLGGARAAPERRCSGRWARAGASGGALARRLCGARAALERRSTGARARCPGGALDRRHARAAQELLAATRGAHVAGLLRSEAPFAPCVARLCCGRAATSTASARSPRARRQCAATSFGASSRCAFAAAVRAAIDAGLGARRREVALRRATPSRARLKQTCADSVVSQRSVAGLPRAAGTRIRR